MSQDLKSIVQTIHLYSFVFKAQKHLRLHCSAQLSFVELLIRSQYLSFTLEPAEASRPSLETATAKCAAGHGCAGTQFLWQSQLLLQKLGSIAVSPACVTFQTCDTCIHTFYTSSHRLHLR